MVTGKGWKVKKGDNGVQCSLIKIPAIYIEPIPRQKIEYLMSAYPHQEWLGYLVGRVSEKENYFVEDISIPPHKEATAASAEAEPFHIPDRCIGIIHSHNTMGAFHSATDKEYVDRNFPVSITVAKKAGQELEYDAISYQMTQCGKGTTVDCPVKYVLPEPLFDKDEFLTAAKEKIDLGKRFIPVVFRYVNEPQGRKYGVGKGGGLMTQKDIDEAMSFW